MLTENKFGKYLIYAIGEIILVVIGILIALAINNWNNEKNDRLAEIKYLNQIKISLQDNHLILKNRIDSDKSSLKYGEILFEHLKSKKPLNPSVMQLFIIPQLDQSVSLSTAAFENIKNSGLSFISNDSLKLDIINMYEQELEYIQTTLASETENYITTVVNPFYSHHFEFNLKENGLSITPNDYEVLLQNREMTNMISMGNALRGYSITNYENTQKKLSELILKIETEIKRLKE